MKWESALKNFHSSMNDQKNLASSKGTREVPSRKLKVPSLQIPPNATQEEVKEMTKEFMDKLRLQGILPPSGRTSKPVLEKKESSETDDLV